MVLGFYEIEGKTLYEDNSRKRLPLMQRKLPLMRCENYENSRIGEDGKNK